MIWVNAQIHRTISIVFTWFILRQTLNLPAVVLSSKMLCGFSWMFAVRRNIRIQYSQCNHLKIRYGVLCICILDWGKKYGLSRVVQVFMAQEQTCKSSLNWTVTVVLCLSVGLRCVSGARTDLKLRWWVWITTASYKFTARIRAWSQWSLMETPLTC